MLIWKLKGITYMLDQNDSNYIFKRNIFYLCK